MVMTRVMITDGDAVACVTMAHCRSVMPWRMWTLALFRPSVPESPFASAGSGTCSCQRDYVA